MTDSILDYELTKVADLAATKVFQENDYHLLDLIRAIERRVILNVMGNSRGNVSDASRRLGLSRTALIYKLEGYGYERD
jgi:DNA-binding NtrC family response regulator